jgi:hypothetical protein
VIEGLEIRLDQRCDDLYTLTVERRVEEPVAPSATLPPELLVPLVFDVCVRGVRPEGWPVPALEPPVVPVVVVVPFVGRVPAPGPVTVLPGGTAVPVGVVGVPAVVGTVVVGVPVGAVPVVVALVGVVLVVVVGPVAGAVLSAGVLSGSISSEIGSGRGRVAALCVWPAGPWESEAPVGFEV